MNLDTELLLVLGIWIFYLQDSAMLLHFDDLLIAGGRRGWRVWTGSDLEMRGRLLFVPGPFLPGRTIYRASWLTPNAGPTERPEALLGFSSRLWPLRVGCPLVGMLLLIVIPWILLTSGDAVWLLAALCVSTALTLIMLAHLSINRRRLELRSRTLAVLAIESLLCPPYAINLYRKMCLKRGFRGDAVLFAKKALPESAHQELRQSIDKRLDLLLLASEGVNSNAGRLHAAQVRIRKALA